MENKKIELKINAVSRKIDNKLFIIPLNGDLSKDGFLFETNDMGSFLWEKISKENLLSINDLVKSTISEYDIDEENAYNDIFNFLRHLERLNILGIK